MGKPNVKDLDQTHLWFPFKNPSCRCAKVKTRALTINGFVSRWFRTARWPRKCFPEVCGVGEVVCQAASCHDQTRPIGQNCVGQKTKLIWVSFPGPKYWRRLGDYNLCDVRPNQPNQKLQHIWSTSHGAKLQLSYGFPAIPKIVKISWDLMGLDPIGDIKVIVPSIKCPYSINSGTRDPTGCASEVVDVTPLRKAERAGAWRGRWRVLIGSCLELAELDYGQSSMQSALHSAL